MTGRVKIIADLLATPVKTPGKLSNEEAQTEAFTTLKSYVDKQTGVHGVTPDWTTIESLALDYLREVARDIRAASYLARAWANLHGPDGVVDGARLLCDLLRVGPKELAPPRVRGRQQALQWWAKQTANAEVVNLAGEASAARRDELLAVIDELSALIAANSSIAGKKELFDELRLALGNVDSAAPSPATAPGDEAPEPDSTGSDTVAAAPPAKLATDTTLAKWLEEIATPISDAQPAGEDGHLSDEFEHLQQQVNDTWRVREVDWQTVFDDSRRYLNRQSKDLRVMAYGSYAALQCDGVRGLSRALAMLSALLTDFGASCHPQRAKGRSAALRWLSQMAEGALKRDLLERVTLEELETCAERAAAVNEQLVTQEQLLVETAALAKIARALKGELEARVSQAPSNKSTPGSTPSVTSTTPRPTPSAGANLLSAAPATSDGVSSADDFRNAVSDAKSFILGLARFKRQTEPKNPIAYKLLRNWLWGTLGTTVQPQNLPPPANRPKWDDLVAAANPEKLLEAAESFLPSSPFCLDTNRYSVLALEQLGADEGAKAVRHELRDFLTRYPMLLDGHFRGDVPLADSETSTWIVSEVLSDGDALVGAARGPSNSDGDIVDVLTEARERVSSGDNAGGIELLDARVRGADHALGRFDWQLALARFLIELRAAELALAHVEALESAIEDHGLERWEPARALEVAWLAQLVDKSIGQKSSSRVRAAALADLGRARICRLSPVQAMEKLFPVR